MLSSHFQYHHHNLTTMGFWSELSPPLLILTPQRESDPSTTIPHSQCSRRRRWQWVFLLFPFFSTIPNYSHRHIINSIVSLSMAQLTLPWLTRGIRSRHHHSLLMKSFMQKAAMVSLPLLFVFPHHYNFSDKFFLLIKLLFSWLLQLPSLSH